MYHSDILIDVCKYLELNEIEKSEYVSNGWLNIIRNVKNNVLQPRRRVHLLGITNVCFKTCKNI